MNNWKDEISITSLLARITSPSPVFWKRMKIRMIVLGSLCSLLLALETQLHVGFTDTFISILKYGISVGATGAFFSQITIKN